MYDEFSSPGLFLSGSRKPTKRATNNEINYFAGKRFAVDVPNPALDGRGELLQKSGTHRVECEKFSLLKLFKLQSKAKREE